MSLTDNNMAPSLKKKNQKYQSSKKTKNFENADFPGQSGYNQGILKQTE